MHAIKPTTKRSPDNIKLQGQGYSSVAQHLPDKCQVMSLIPGNHPPKDMKSETSKSNSFQIFPITNVGL